VDVFVPSDVSDKTVQLTLIKMAPGRNGQRATVIGRVKTCHQSMILLDVKGQSVGQIFTPDEVYSIDVLANEAPVEQVRLNMPTLVTVRKHLVVNHGVKLSVVNRMTEKEAWDYHEKDHADHFADLGHRHGAVNHPQEGDQ